MLNKLNVLIVEDDFSYALELEMLLKNLDLTHIGTVDNSSDAFFEILDKKPDLILMDIDIIGKLSGLDIAKRLLHLDISIIFITSFRNEAYYEAATAMNNATFMMKPIEKLTLKATIELLVRKKSFKSSNHRNVVVKDGALFLKRKESFQKLAISDILYIESNRVYCKTVTSDKQEYLNRISLNDYSIIIQDYNFIKTHRSFLVNRSKVETVNFVENFLIVGGENVPISRSAKSYVKEHFRFIS